MNTDSPKNFPFFTPNKKMFFLEENLSLLNTAFTAKNEDINMERNCDTLTPVHNSVKKEGELITSPLMKFRRRIITPAQSYSEEDLQSVKSLTQESLFDLTFDNLSKKNSFHLFKRESSNDSILQRQTSSKKFLKFEEISRENLLHKESSETMNELKGSILLYYLENGNSLFSLNKLSVRTFFESNQSLLNKIVKDVSYSFVEGLNSRDYSLFFKFISNSTQFDIVGSGLSNLDDCVKFLDDNIDSLVPVPERSQTDFYEKEGEKLVYSLKGECKMNNNNSIYFILSLMIRVDLYADFNCVSNINEVVGMTDIKLLVFENN
jgi:hypothetical protein